MSETVKLEAVIAWPPTSKCQATIEVLEEVVRRHPDQVRLVVFKRGFRDFPEQPSLTLVRLLYKGCAVPACFLDGSLLAILRVPTLDEVETRVAEKLGQPGGIPQVG